jgi:hypothetical protein
MKRGEVHGGCAFALSTLKSVRRGDWKAGRLKVLIQLGFEKHPDFGKTPHIYDFAKSKDDRKVMELIFGRQTLGRPLGGPPALPAARTKALRAAFSATVKDPAFLKAAGRRRLNIDPMSGEEVDKLIARFQSYPEPIVARARAALKLGKVVKVKLKKANGVIAKISKKKLTIKDGKGGIHSYKLHRRRSKVTIAGKKAKASALKAGMSCALRHYGENDLARKIDCK